MKKKTLTPQEKEIARILIEKGSVSLVDYISISGGMDLCKAKKSFRAVMAKISGVLAQYGIKVPTIKNRDGSLEYRFKKEQVDAKIDMLMAELSTVKAEHMLLSGEDIAVVQEEIENAKRLDISNRRLSRIRHFVALRQADNMDFILDMAHINICRQVELEKRLNTLEEMTHLDELASFRAQLEKRMHAYEHEYRELAELKVLTLARRLQSKHCFENNKSLMRLCSLSILSRYLEGTHREIFRNAFADSPAIRQLAGPIAGHLLKKVNAYANISISFDDILMTTQRVITLFMLDDLAWHKFVFQDSIGKLSAYICRSCLNKVYVAVAAEQACSSEDKVALAFRIWKLEKRGKSKEEIMISLKLDNKAYDSVFETTSVLKEKRLGPELLKKLTRDHLPAIQETNAHRKCRAETEIAIKKLIKHTKPHITCLARQWMVVRDELIREDNIDNPSDEQIKEEMGLNEKDLKLLKAFLNKLKEILGEDGLRMI